MRIFARWNVYLTRQLPTEMATWHNDSECSRLDLFESDGLVTCLNCGSSHLEQHPGDGLTRQHRLNGGDAEESIGNESDADYSHAEISDEEEEQEEEEEEEAYLTTALVPSVGESCIHRPIRQRSQMRIFLLHPAEIDDPVCGELVTVDVGLWVEYDAISYTWADETGDATKCCSVFIGADPAKRVPFPVPRNCEAVLRRVRKRFYTQHLWIDSICIDQDNIEERGHQVDLMPQIYTRARKTYIYTGQATDFSDRVLRYLNDKASAEPKPYSGPKYVTDSHVDDFLRRPYFSRIWVVQEIALSKNAVLVDKDEYPWSIFGSVKAAPPRKPLLSLAVIRQLQDPSQLMSMLRLGRDCQSSDPRDKVFALLGLIVGAGAEGLVADYSRSVADVYTWIARYLIDVQKVAALDILGEVNLVEQGASQAYDLPSWVPDWSNSGQTFRQSLYAAERIDSKHFKLSTDPDNSRALLLAGHVFVNIPFRSIEWVVRNYDHRSVEGSDEECGCAVCADLLPEVVGFRPFSDGDSRLLLLLPCEEASSDLEPSSTYGTFKFVGTGRQRYNYGAVEARIRII